MSTMLEQAIVDAKALREAALKNAEQAVIEKYAPEIKSAVESLLNEAPEAEAEGSVASSVEVPYAAQPQTDSNQEVEMSFDFEFDPEDFQIDLEDLKAKAEEDPTSAGEEPEAPGETIGDLDLGGEQEAGADEGGLDDLQLQELLNMLNDATQELVEEELVVDTGEDKAGWTTTDAGTRKYQQELELARMESTKWKEENEALVQRIKELQ
ncbi:MAG: hypothetical protein VYC14_06060, partial [Actinomycetota bacterium]|nr:hypothetical protein [Actinomycetota bacterium]